MKKCFAWTLCITALMASGGLNAQLSTDINKNFIFAKGYTSPFDQDHRTHHMSMGMDVNSKGDVIVATMTEKNGQKYPAIYKIYHEDQHGLYSEYDMNDMFDFGYKNTVNEVKVLHDDWVVVCGMEYVAFLNRSLETKVVFNRNDHQEFWDANFIEVSETPDGRVAILYAYSREMIKDALGVLLCDFKKEEYYFSEIYEGELAPIPLDVSISNNVLSNEFEMEALSNDHLFIGFQTIAYEQENWNDYLVVDLNKLTAHGQGGKSESVVAQGRFTEEERGFMDMAYDSASQTMYVMTGWSEDVLFSTAEIDDVTNITFEPTSKVNAEKFKSPTSNVQTMTLMTFGGRQYLAIGGEGKYVDYGVDYEGPNVNIFSPYGLSQLGLGGRSVINSLGEEKNILDHWTVKEIVPIGVPHGPDSNGNYQQAVAVAVYRKARYSSDKGWMSRVYIVDLTYMKLE